MHYTLIALTALLIATANPASGEIIPSSRRITWQGNVGVSGGIPNRTTIFANVKNAPYNAVGNGVNDDTAEIQAALDACPSGQVVYVPAGTYKISGTLTVKNNTTMRGAGRTSTILQCTNLSHKIKFGTGTRYMNDGATPYYNISGSPAKGATSITLTSTPGAEMAVGNLMWLDQINDGTIPLGDDLVTKEAGGQACDHCSRSTGNRVMTQCVLITGKSGNTITFEPGLYYGRSAALTPQAFSLGLSGEWIGVEDMKISSVTADGGYADGNTFHMEVAKYCWVKNVESDFTSGDHVRCVSSFRCEVRDSYFHDAYVHGPGQTEGGIMLGFSSGCLYENNIIRRAHAPIYINWGASGNVIGYNYTDNNYNTLNPTHFFGGIYWHGAHPMMNLIEGNVVERIFQDNVWGNASHETVFRNYITGVQTHCPPYDARGAEQTASTVWPFYARFVVYLGWGSRNFNFVGNVLGAPDFVTNWSSSAGPGNGTPIDAEYSILPPEEYSPYQIPSWLWVAGYGSTSEHTEIEAWDSTLKHGNWDVVTETVIWDGSIADHTIPESLYLPSKPAWFGTLAWPPFNSSNPSAASVDDIPAGYRYLNGSDPPAGGGSSIQTLSVTNLTITGP